MAPGFYAIMILYCFNNIILQYYTLSPNKKPSNCVFAPTNFLLFAARCKSGVCNFLLFAVFLCPRKPFRLPRGASWARLGCGSRRPSRLPQGSLGARLGGLPARVFVGTAESRGRFLNFWARQSRPEISYSNVFLFISVGVHTSTY